MDTPEQQRLLEEAATWSTRLASPECGAAERAQFDAWRNRTPEHAHAWAQVSRIEGQLAGLDGNAELQALADAAYAAGGPAPAFGSGRRRLLAMAAGAAAIGLGALLVRLVDGEAAVTRYQTASAADARRSVLLADGSRVELDVDSAIEVDIADRERRVVLRRGRAIFEVAHDAGRPFSVDAGAGQTLALGTRFQVDQRGAAVLVTLAQGSVLVSGQGANEGLSEVLKPGEQLRYTQGADGWHKQSVDLQAALGWERGRLVFHGTPLGEAVQDINRYADRPIRLADAALGALPVNGNFIAGDSLLVATALEQTLPLQARSAGAEIVLEARPR